MNTILIILLKSSLAMKMCVDILSSCFSSIFLTGFTESYSVTVFVFIVGTHEMHIFIKPGSKKKTKGVKYFTNSIVMQITLTTCKSRCMFVSLWKILFYIWPRMRYLFCLKNVWLDRSVFIYVQFSSILD